MAPVDWTDELAKMDVQVDRTAHVQASVDEILPGLNAAVAEGGIDCETVVLAVWAAAATTRRAATASWTSILGRSGEGEGDWTVRRGSCRRGPVDDGTWYGSCGGDGSWGATWGRVGGAARRPFMQGGWSGHGAGRSGEDSQARGDK